MINFLLDVRADPGFFERNGYVKWLIVAAIAAIAGIVVWYVVNKRKAKKS